MPLFRHEVGKQLYVWTADKGGKSQNAAMISAHGVQALIGGMDRVPKNIRLLFYSPHGQNLADNGLLSALSGALKPVPASGQGQDYTLEKYQNSARTRHNQGTEDYGAIAGMPELFAGFVSDPRASAEQIAMFSKLKMDIITIRNRRMMASPRLSTVLLELHAKGFSYTEIHCNFCRGSHMGNLKQRLGMGEAPFYDPWAK